LYVRRAYELSACARPDSTIPEQDLMSIERAAQLGSLSRRPGAPCRRRSTGDVSRHRDRRTATRAPARTNAYGCAFPAQFCVAQAMHRTCIPWELVCCWESVEIPIHLFGRLDRLQTRGQVSSCEAGLQSNRPISMRRLHRHMQHRRMHSYQDQHRASSSTDPGALSALSSTLCRRSEEASAKKLKSLPRFMMAFSHLIEYGTAS
jgi:hypothetical protein